MLLPDGGIVLVNEVEQTFRQFLYLPNEQSYTVPSLWVPYAALRDGEGNTLPYINPRLGWFSKLPGCGKTLGMELTTLMSPNGEMLVNPTPPSLIMMLDREKNTVGFDEFDQYFTQNKTTMAAVLNTGYKRGAVITKVRQDQIIKERVYGPMVLSGKNLTQFLTLDRFDTLRTRTHVIMCERAPEDAPIDEWDPELYEPRLRALGREIAEWGVLHAPEILKIDPEMPKGINNRDREIWKVLFQIAEYIGGEWPRKCTEAAKAFVLNQWGEAKASVPPSLELRNWAQTVFADDEQYLTSEEIVARLMALPTEHWWKNEWSLSRMRSATMSLSRQLSVFGISHTKLRVGSETPWGYTREDLGLPECSNQSAVFQPSGGVPTSSDVPTVPTSHDEYGYVLPDLDEL